MKVLHISPFYSGGGAERCARDFFELQKKQGMQTTMWTALRRDTDPPDVHSIRLPGERYLLPLDYALYYTDWRHVGSIWKLESLRRGDFDVVHVHNIHGNWISIGAVKRLCERLPVVWTLHDEWAPTGGLVCDLSRVLPLEEAKKLSSQSSRFVPYYETRGVKRLRGFLKKNMPRPAAIIAVSHHTSRLVDREGWFPGIRKYRIPYALPLLDEPNTSMPRAEARAQLKIPANARVALIIAQYLNVPHKGMDLAVAALRAIPAAERPHVLVLGKGTDEIQQQLAGFSLTTGYAANQAELARAYRAADVMLIPSRAEGYGYVVVESFACETPVVAFKVGSLPELIGDSERGLLADPFDVEQLSTALRKLLDDAPLRERLGTAARTWVRRECDTTSVLDQIRDVYETVSGKQVTRAS
jgi:glycosyltransferase involved in cell wall biosynthesis